LEAITANALNSDDLYIINGYTGADKKIVLHEILQALTGVQAPAVSQTLSEYTKQLMNRCRPAFPVTFRMEEITNTFKNAPYTHAAALALLGDTYHTVLTALDGAALNGLNRCMDGLRISVSKSQPLTDAQAGPTRNEILQLLNEITEAVRAYEEKDGQGKHKPLKRLAEGMDETLLEKYVNRDCTAYPFLYNDTVILDMDTCTNEDAITNALTQAKRIIMAGTYISGTYKIFYDAALRRQRADGRNRLAVCRTVGNQHPKLAAFIQRNLQDIGFTEDSPAFTPKHQLPVFTWVAPEGVEGGGLTDMLAPGLSTGIAAPDADSAREMQIRLRTEDNDLSHIRTGNELDLHGMLFDVLFLVLEDINIDDKKLFLFMALVSQSLVIIGEHKNLKGGSVLRKFYCLCEGDKTHGRVIK
jgi:hypothetical protein